MRADLELDNFWKILWKFLEKYFEPFLKNIFKHFWEIFLKFLKKLFEHLWKFKKRYFEHLWKFKKKYFETFEKIFWKFWKNIWTKSFLWQSAAPSKYHKSNGKSFKLMVDVEDYLDKFEEMYFDRDFTSTRKKQRCILDPSRSVNRGFTACVTAVPTGWNTFSHQKINY